MKTHFSVALAIMWSLAGWFIYGQSLFFNYITPVPGSEYINPEQSLILKTGIPFDHQPMEGCNIMIMGSESGSHTFT
jgi:hypothetical protein